MEFSPDHTLSDLFRAQAARTPDAAAVTCGSRTLSYAQLDSRSDALANELAALGVGPESLVGLLMDRSAEMVVGVLGILKAGGAYVPIDVTNPPARIAAILEDSAPETVVTRSTLAQLLPPEHGDRVFIDELPSTSAIHATPTPAAASNAAYVIYTSGSTGKPKGVVVTHRNVVRLFTATRKWFDFRCNDVWALFHSIAFDVSVGEMWGALLFGGRLVVVSQDVTRAPDRFRELMVAEGVTVLRQTPSAFRMLMHADAIARGSASLALRYVIFAGERLDLPTLEPWIERHGDETPKLINMYGITETTVDVTYRRIRAVDLQVGMGSVIGEPIPDLSVYLLDSEARPVPVGTPGEIYVGGAGVARGYLNRPELTDGRFLPDPFRGESGARMYRSGDLARALPNGDMEYLGRIDQQVKIRGFRIELGEVESAVRAVPSVRDVAVVAREGADGEKTLVGYVVTDGGRSPDDERALRTAVRARAEQRLPEYMVPAAVVIMDGLPLTPNGKLDVRALPPPDDLSRQATAASDDVPHSEVELAIADVWQSVLGVQHVGVESDFFQLGGHSLLAVRVLVALREHLGIELSLGAMFETPTIGQLAACVEALLREEDSCRPAPPLGRVERRTLAPASISQAPLWYLWRVEPNPAVYNLPLAVRISGPLRIDIVQRCLDTLEARHESLRTTIVSPDGTPMQRIQEPSGLPIKRVSLDADEATSDGVETALQREVMAPFDLVRGPLARATLFEVGPDEHYLLLVMHHIVSDGESTLLLLEELAALYEAFRQGEAAPLDPDPMQFVDFAVWERERVASGALDGQLAYWRERLGGTLPVLDLPADKPRPPIRSGNGARVAVRLPTEAVAELARIGGAEGTTSYMVLLALFVTLLHRYSGADDLIVGTPIGNRAHAGTEEIVGYVSNVLALRTGVDGAMTFRDVLRAVRETCIGAFRNQDLPFPIIADALDAPRDPSRTRIFQAFLSVLRDTSTALGADALRLETLEVGTGAARTDVALFLRDRGGAVDGALEYSTDLFTPATARAMAEHFQRLAMSAAASPDSAIAALDMAAPTERAALDAWNATDAPIPDRTIHALIAAQADSTPDRIAVEADGETLTYRELETRANRLAHLLQAHGIGNGHLVGVCLPRCNSLLVGLLGVLKSGAAYVPLDPDFPEARIAYMLDDANVRVVVTDVGTAHTLRLTSEDREQGAVGGAGRVVVCVDEPGVLDGYPDHVPTCAATSESLAYVIYTSGSTGEPKGVELTHRNVVNLLAAMRDTPGIAEDDVLVAVTTPSFDIAALELFLPLTVGARVVLASREAARDGERLGQLIEESGATVMQATPVTWRLLLDGGWRGRGGFRALCGGEPLPPDLARDLLERVGELWNMYGPTETTIWSTCAQITDSDAPITIGTPIANTVVRVADGSGRQTPVGIPGELVIGGAGVARGYLHRPELTAERFIKDPTGRLPDVSFYRTGDRARMRPDGQLQHLGRFDDQVKVLGFRIELGEIEAALRGIPEVHDSVAAVHSFAPGDARLVAYVLYEAGEQLTTSEVRRHLRRRLPDYMIPGLIVEIDAVPRTANGKVNRAALPNPLASVAEKREYVPPATDAERMVAETWRDVLEVERVGRGDNFFELGGHSLLSIRAVAAIERRTGIRIDPRLMFFQTVEQIAAQLAAEAPAVRT